MLPTPTILAAEIVLVARVEPAVSLRFYGKKTASLMLEASTLVLLV